MANIKKLIMQGKSDEEIKKIISDTQKFLNKNKRFKDSGIGSFEGLEIKTVKDFFNVLHFHHKSTGMGYPVYFIMKDGEPLSIEDAIENAKLIAESIKEGYDDQWIPVATEVNWEDEDLYSSHSNKKIPSAYGEEDINIESKIKADKLEEEGGTLEGECKDVGDDIAHKHFDIIAEDIIDATNRKVEEFEIDTDEAENNISTIIGQSCLRSLTSAMNEHYGKIESAIDLKYKSPMRPDKQIRLWYGILEIIDKNPSMTREEILEELLYNETGRYAGKGWLRFSFNDAMTVLRADGYIINKSEDKDSNYELTDKGEDFYLANKDKFKVKDDIELESKIKAKVSKDDEALLSATRSQIADVIKIINLSKNVEDIRAEAIAQLVNSIDNINIVIQSKE